MVHEEEGDGNDRCPMAHEKMEKIGMIDALWYTRIWGWLMNNMPDFITSQHVRGLSGFGCL